MKWSIKEFNKLTNNELYEICKSRYEVFVCEQKIYQENDFDGIDKEAYHLFLEDNEKVVAYARVIPSKIISEYSTIGRVLVLKDYRRRGIAEELIKKGIDFLCNKLKEDNICISAQLYVKSLYEKVGFEVISDVYNEVEIPHVKMKLTHN